MGKKLLLLLSEAVVKEAALMPRDVSEADLTMLASDAEISENVSVFLHYFAGHIVTPEN